MDPRLQLRVQRYGWDAAADYYNDGWEAQLRPAHDQLLQSARLTKGQKVIETACGSGLVTMRIAKEVGSAGKVHATDLSQGMIDKLRAWLDAVSSKNVKAERMAAEKLSVPDSVYDAAICALGLMYTPDPTMAVSEMARVVRPRGTVAATVWGERKNCGWADVFPIVDARVASEVCPMFFGTGVPGALKRLFENAGLQKIGEHRHFETLFFEDEEDVVDAALMGGPVALAVKRFSDDVWADVVNEFLESVATYRQRDGSYSIPGEFVTVSGVRPVE